MSTTGHLHVGTSGWHYPHWRGTFYPAVLPTRLWLPYYAERFRTAEVNNSFYKLPAPETFAAWRSAVPDGFVFAVKANRFITHMKKLKDPHEPLANLYERLAVLGPSLGPVLYQLPPFWRFDPGRLEAFLEALPTGFRHVFEFREPTWFNEQTYALLARHGAAFCLYELAGLVSPDVLTAGFAYVRLHGPGSIKYQGSYDRATLAAWLARFDAWRQQGRDVYCYFDNDEAGYAAHNALTLQEMAGPCDVSNNRPVN